VCSFVINNIPNVLTVLFCILPFFWLCAVVGTLENSYILKFFSFSRLCSLVFSHKIIIAKHSKTCFSPPLLLSGKLFFIFSHCLLYRMPLCAKFDLTNLLIDFTQFLVVSIDANHLGSRATLHSANLLACVLSQASRSSNMMLF
jgi:hypothetical protein